MDQARFLRVKELFQQALAWPPGERARRLAEACAGDDGLQAEVVDLLAHAAAAGPGFLAASAVPVGAPAPPVLALPGFRLLEQLASGGSGSVYRAEQESPRREVALKVLRLDSLAPGHVARFEREAAILAGLDHPGIARVIQAGVLVDGALRVPWIALEFVRGVTLDEHVREGRPDLRTLLELFAAVCDAVEHAHAKGIVHRDLKPSNVMIDEAGRPRVLDFGVARAREGSLAALAAGPADATRTGMLVGTLVTMAPEQARGERDLDARADVYALGAVLFELLTGLAPVPLDELDLVAAVRAVCDQEPTPLRRLRPDLPRDLETILAKTLAKEPERRYASAGALAADLRRLLADRPVLARPATAVYQARKFVRRNRALSLATLAVVLALAAGLGFALVNLRDARRKTALAVESAGLLSRLMLELSPQLGFGAKERGHMESTLALLERLRDAGADRRGLAGLCARLLYELASLDQADGNVPAMRARLEAARALREELAAADPGDLETRTHLSQIYAKLGEAAYAEGGLAERDAWFARALGVDEALVREFPDDPELVEDLGWSLERLAMAAAERGDRPAADRLHLRRLAEAEDLAARGHRTWKVLYNLTHALHFAAGIHLERGEPELAAAQARECVRVARQVHELEPGRREFLHWLTDTCLCAQDLLTRIGAADEARRLGEEALGHAEALVLGDPQRAEHLDLLRRVVLVQRAAGDGAVLAHAAQRLTQVLLRVSRTASAESTAALRELAAQLEAEVSTAARADPSDR